MNESPKLIAFIVDDNPAALESLASDLRKYPEFEAVHTFTSYTEATLPLLEEQPDVLFLDIETPERNGLEFLSSIRPRINFTFKVVFYTAFSNYMIDAIRQSAFDFLLKPYKQEELTTIINRLVNDKQHILYTARTAAAMPRKIAMQTISELLLITAEQVLLFYYSSELRSWILTLTDKTEHQLKKSAKSQEILTLSPTFIRVSNTCIINVQYLAAIENNTQRCRLCPPFDDVQVIASRRYFTKLRELFELF